VILKNKKRFLVIALFAVYQLLNAQGGGPPMIIDDPGTPPKGKFEFNISLLSNITETENEYQTPLFDLNYGLNQHTQLKIEMPYLINSGKEDNSNRLGSPLLGIKYRFLDEDKNNISVSTYPQINVPINSKDSLAYLLPLEFEKNLDSVVVAGCEIGFGWDDKGCKYIKSGLLASKGFGVRFEAILELVGFYNVSAGKWGDIIINAGARYSVNENIIIMMAAGYNLNESINIQNVLGVQFLF
jgi:hypothetical protein